MRLLRRLSIRVRITAGSVLVGAVVLVASAVALHVQIDRASLETDRSLAMSDAAPFVGTCGRTRGRHRTARPRDCSSASVRHRGRGCSTGCRTACGTLPRTVEHETTLRLTEHGHRTTVVGIPVRNDTGSYVVWAAQDGRAAHETLERVDRSLVVGTLLALVAFAGTAWLLTTLALRPVGRMRRTAEAISAGSSDGHLPEGRTDDELAGLARTLNAFLDRQRDNAERERRMVSDASHELRTPLAALTARLELAHRSSGDAAALERELSAAEADAARLVALANTMLELSRLDEQGPTPSTPAADLVSELMSSIDRARAIDSMGPRDVDFTVEVGVPEARHGVGPAAFARVVDNLVANAIAAGDVDGVVRVDLRQDTDRTLVLTVVDDGPGVPEAFLPQAFDRFTRADDSRTALGGSGLGLALVRGIAERAGGSATLENGDGGGAVATVRLPPV